MRTTYALVLLSFACLVMSACESVANDLLNDSVNMTSKGTATQVPPDIRNILEFRHARNATERYDPFQQPLVPNPSDDKHANSGVTIRPAKHLGRAISSFYKVEPRTSLQVLDAIDDARQRGPILQSSFDDNPSDRTHPSRNGFIKAAIHAYNQHHHLRIRPDDIWLAILTQFSAYINAHSEELRGSFVAHNGKKELVICYDDATRFTVDWAEFAHNIGLMIQDNVVDPELRAWMMPRFTTSTQHDTIVASIVMMASMQKYFSYTAIMTCGLPSVTLLGTKQDYELILQRLNKFRNYGPEPSHFADLLTPVIKRFIQSFENPESKDVIDFWNRIVTEWNMGSGTTYLSGWITAFIFWDEDGKMLYDPNQGSWIGGKSPKLSYDGVTYQWVGMDKIPTGFSKVPVKIIDNGVKVMSEMLAGSVGIEFSTSGEEIEGGGQGQDTMQPHSGWWIYETVEGSDERGNEWDTLDEEMDSYLREKNRPII